MARYKGLIISGLNGNCLKFVLENFTAIKESDSDLYFVPVGINLKQRQGKELSIKELLLTKSTRLSPRETRASALRKQAHLKKAASLDNVKKTVSQHNCSLQFVLLNLRVAFALNNPEEKFSGRFH